MSTFVISFNQDFFDPEMSDVKLSPDALDTLFEVLYTPLSVEMSDVEGWAEDYRHMYEKIKTQELSELTPKAFGVAYDLIVDATNKHDELKPYADELINALQADPRYKAVEPA